VIDRGDILAYFGLLGAHFGQLGLHISQEFKDKIFGFFGHRDI
jgi:hypothetical protein